MATASNSYVINAQAAQMHPFNRAQTTTPTQNQQSIANLQPGFQTPSPSSTDVGHHQAFLLRQGMLSAASSPAPVYSASLIASPAGYPPSGYPPSISGTYGTRPSSASGLKRPPTPASRFSTSDGSTEVSKKLVLPGIETLLAPITPPPRASQSSPDSQMFRYNGPSPFPVTPMQSPSANSVHRSPVNLPSIRSLEKDRAGSGASDTTSVSSETQSNTSQSENVSRVSTATSNVTVQNSVDQPHMPGTAGQDDFDHSRTVAHAAPVPSHPIVISGHGIMGGSPAEYYGHQHHGTVVQQQQPGNGYVHLGQHSHASPMQQHHMHQQHQQSPYGYSPSPNQAYNAYYNGYQNQYPPHAHANGSPSVPQDIERHHIGMGIYTVNGQGSSMLDCQMMNGSFSFQTGNGTHPPLITSKDIKRRTKTGCLTCRKRRIKCDETHPTCKNCDKSKRVCLGYDPIFQAVTEKRRRKSSSSSGRISKNTTGMSTPSASPRKSKGELSSGSASPIADSETPISLQNGHSRMKIDSLLAAAASLEEEWDWLKLYQTYSDNVGLILDSMLGCNRFRQIVPLFNGKKKNSGSIPSKLTSGEDLAVLEVIRQIMTSVRPGWTLDNLSVDETSMVKLEELRITDDYKLLRNVAQLLGSHASTEYLAVSDTKSDKRIQDRVFILHRLIYGVSAQRIQSHKMQINSVQQESHEVITEEMINKMLESKSSTIAWKVLQLLSTGQQLTEDQIDQITTGVMSLSCFWQLTQCDSPLSTSSESAGDSSFKFMKMPLLIGLHYCARKCGYGAAQTRLRGLLEQTEDIDWLNQRLVQMALA